MNNPNVYEYFVSTGNCLLIEAVNDKFWESAEFRGFQACGPRSEIVDCRRFLGFNWRPSAAIGDSWN
uniref:Uncharacterized protein n=1 Tax=Romanomermis culicivorax TaxID=13658 RepID=A0A915HQQ6_ROMCU